MTHSADLDAPPARPEVEGLRAYSAPLEGRRGLLRLDFNENTVGPSPHVVAAIRAIFPAYGARGDILLICKPNTPTGTRLVQGSGCRHLGTSWTPNFGPRIRWGVHW